MGLFMSRALEDNMKRQQEFMLLNQRLQMERQMAMQSQMQLRQMAMQLAGSREFFKYYASFYSLATVTLTAGAMRSKRPGLLVPLVPLGFVLAYQYDRAYGSMLQRMRDEAEWLMDKDAGRLQLPHGLPTFEDVEKCRRANVKFPPASG
ncbi:plasminogen receptor (KT) [Lethenteron reissneri]|uniref:plasminogen receptor (KT) n=1 Tax=Lethenteron reissneri TaxID=7753 RepID=UPI002AB714D6|nr:plasminogen receptor (KT) [Lethenteron reissneri]